MERNKMIQMPQGFHHVPLALDPPANRVTLTLALPKQPSRAQREYESGERVFGHWEGGALLACLTGWP